VTVSSAAEDDAAVNAKVLFPGSSPDQPLEVIQFAASTMLARLAAGTFAARRHALHRGALTLSLQRLSRDQHPQPRSVAVHLRPGVYRQDLDELVGKLGWV